MVSVPVDVAVAEEDNEAVEDSNSVFQLEGEQLVEPLVGLHLHREIHVLTSL